MDLVFGSTFSGIEGASVALEPLGWRPAFYAEVDPFACAVLAARHGSNLPGKQHTGNGVPNFGDVTTIDPQKCVDIDVLIGGSPCQAFSVAGLRGSLSDARGNLTLAYVRLAHAINDLRRSRGKPGLIVIWENVPGVLSTTDNAFGSFLAGLVGADAPLKSPYERGRWTDAGLVAGPAGSAAWRVVDAQHFRLAQRRRRVFLVASLGNRLDPAQVLFEPKSLQRYFGKGEATRKGSAADAEEGAGVRSHWDGLDNPHPTLNQSARGSGGVGASNQELFSQRGAYLVDGKVQDVAATLEATAGRSRGAGTPVSMLTVHPFCEKNSVCHNPNACDGNTCWLLSQPSYLPDTSPALRARDYKGTPQDVEEPAFVAHCATGDITHALKADGFDGSEDGTGRGQPIVPAMYRINGKGEGFDEGDLSAPLTTQTDPGSHDVTAFDTTQITHPANRSVPKAGDPCHPLAAEGHPPAVAFQPRFARNDRGAPDTIAAPLTAEAGRTGKGDSAQCIATTAAVRRLTPEECEALQGFPRGYTRIAWRGKPESECPDGPRYKCLGNSFATPCVRWIGERIELALAEEAGHGVP